MNKHLAVIGVGIVGTGKHNEGIPAFVQALQVLSKEYRITVYSFIPVNKQNVSSDIRVRCVPFANMPIRLCYMYLGVIFFLDHLRKRIDLVHAQSPFPAGVLAFYIRRIFNIPWLLSFHATEAVYMPERNFGDLMNRSLAKKSIAIAQHADAIMTMSKFQVDDIRKNLAVTKSIQVLPRGIEVPALESKRLRLPLQFIHISYYQPVKDHATLLKTIARVNRHVDFELKIIGDNYGQEFENQIRTLAPGVKINVIGPLPHRQIIDELKKADLLIHTSFYEGLPMVALEAMAHGVVVCGTHVGIMADLSGKGCVTAPVGDDERLADAIIGIANAPDKFSSCRTQAHQWVKAHDMNGYISELKKCYDNLIGRK